MYYAGIGSRKAPQDILSLIEEIASDLQDRGFTLRSGGAKGADLAFESGAGDAKEIFYAEDCTEEAIEIATKFHPSWSRCSDYARRLHGRNSLILLGRDLNDPVEFIVCWTPGARIVGGTGQSLRIAKDHGIKIFNLADYKQRTDLLSYLGKS